MTAREWVHPDLLEGTPESARPTARLDLEAWQRRIRRADYAARTGAGLRSSGMFAAVKVTVRP